MFLLHRKTKISSPEQPEAAVRLSPIPAALLTEDFVVAEANDAWSELLQRPPSAFVGELLNSIVRGDERTALELLLDKFSKSSEIVLRLYVHLALSPAELRRALLILHRRDGMMLAHIIDLADSSADQGERAQLLDAIEHAAWEWRRTFDAVESPIVIVNADLTIGRINRSARMLAGKEYGEIVGRPASALGATEPWQTIGELALQVQRARSPAARQVRDSAGRTLDLLAMLFNAEDPRDGRVIVIAWDVTALVDLQTRYEQQRTMAAIGALVAGVAHEVRNPLFGISATLDAMETLATPQLAEYFEVLRHESDRMTELMRDLLAYGRPSAPSLTKFAVGEIIEAAVRASTPLAAKSGIPLRIKMTDDGEVLADRDRLMRAVQNIIDNAVQHSSGAAGVEIECCTPKGRARNVIVAVRDHGKGFSEEDLPRVFEPFFSRRSGGTGLGLALVQQIVTDSGGHVEATNRRGGGAQVSIVLPLVRK
jgi:signal transduction histidine kinase